MDQNPLVRLPADDLAPYVRHARLGRDSGLLRTSYLGGATLFLGTLYPDSLDIEDSRLLQYLDLRPSDARAWYYARLLETCAQARHDPDQAEFERILRLERLYWEQADDRWIDERIEPLLDKVTPYAAPGGHWLFNGKLRRYPAINWRGQHEVSITRLLWVRACFDIELKPDANLFRNTEDCTGRDWLNRCVNPHHFRLKNEQALDHFTDRLRSGKTGRFVADGEPKSTVAWSARNVREEYGRLVVFHPECDGTLSQSVQEAFNAGVKRGTGYCPKCYLVQKEFRRKFPKVQSGITTPARLQAMNDELFLIINAHGGSGGPQQAPTEDEEPWTPTIVNHQTPEEAAEAEAEFQRSKYDSDI